AVKVLFYFCCDVDHRDLPSFPTRRSSDLVVLAGYDVPSTGAGKSRVAFAADGFGSGATVPSATRCSNAVCQLGSSVLSCSQSTKDRKSTRLNSSHSQISYAVFCLKHKFTL